MIYFDSAATTLQKPESVYAAVQRTMRACASVGRGGHAAADAAARVVYACRTEAAELFDAVPEQIVFTMNATHGLNIALRSLVRPGGRVVLSGMEHNAVTRPLAALGAQIETAGAPPFAPERLLEGFARALRQGAAAAVCTHVSNVYGNVLPVSAIAALCRERGVPLIIDASQSAGTLPVSLSGTGAAFIAMPGHKGLYGPQGTGLLLCGAAGEPLLLGGTGSNSLDQSMPDFLPDRHEAGTHNVCGIGGLLAGLRFVRERRPEELLAVERALTALAARGLRQLPGVEVFTGPGQCGVLSFRCRDLDCEEAAARLAEAGIAVRAGLHCAPMAHRSGGTLETGTVRVSFSAFNTSAEVRQFLQVCRTAFCRDEGKTRVSYLLLRQKIGYNE